MRTQIIKYREDRVFICEVSKSPYRTVCMLHKHGRNDYIFTCVELDFPFEQKKAKRYLVKCLIETEEYQEDGWSVRGTKEDILEELILFLQN